MISSANIFTSSRNLNDKTRVDAVEHVQCHQPTEQAQRNDANACAAHWNTFLGTIGSFADDHTTL
jgi:hypothetical protein